MYSRIQFWGGKHLQLRRKDLIKKKQEYLKLNEKSNVSKTVDLLYKINAKTNINIHFFFGVGSKCNSERLK